MSSYTMTLKEVIEMITLDQTISLRDRIEKGRKALFDFDYPIFDPNYRKVFETHFIRTFYMREIGFETDGLFKFNLETWLLVNMPYFNKLFESELKEFDPFINTKLDTTQKRTSDREQSQTSKTEGIGSANASEQSNSSVVDDNFNRRLESNTPDGRLNLTAKDGEGVIEYASNIKEDNQNNKTTGSGSTTGSTSNSSTVNGNVNGSINETEDYLQSRIGKVGNDSYSKLLTEYRESFIRIEKRIFNEMNELFMLVY